MPRHPKIICTLGPSSSKKDVIRSMAHCGMAVARLNFSHGTHREHLRRIIILKDLNKKIKPRIKILQDLEGFRIRVGDLKKERILKKDQEIEFAKIHQCWGRQIPFDYQQDNKAIKKGYEVFIDDGNIICQVIESDSNKIRMKVLFGGRLKSRKGINIPKLQLTFDALTQKDEDDLIFGIRNKVDFITQSFVRNKKDILRIEEIVRSHKYSCKIIAKIENQEGLHNLEKIIDVSDGIMVARGDLGISIPIYKIAMIQKDIICQCLRKKKFVITATQMLENMVEHNRPTRAEVSDVTNAVLDGSDYVMLSAETAAGHYPVLCVKMMKQIINFAKTHKPSCRLKRKKKR